MLAIIDICKCITTKHIGNNYNNYYSLTSFHNPPYYFLGQNNREAISIITIYNHSCNYWMPRLMSLWSYLHVSQIQCIKYTPTRVISHHLITKPWFSILHYYFLKLKYNYTSCISRLLPLKKLKNTKYIVISVILVCIYCWSVLHGQVSVGIRYPSFWTNLS